MLLEEVTADIEITKYLNPFDRNMIRTLEKTKADLEQELKENK